MRFYAGDVCPKNHRIRDLVTHTKIPFSVRYKRDDKCAWCTFWSRVNNRTPKKKRGPRLRDGYATYKDKRHRT